jgi:hypothetical protein
MTSPPITNKSSRTRNASLHALPSCNSNGHPPELAPAFARELGTHMYHLGVLPARTLNGSRAAGLHCSLMWIHRSRRRNGCWIGIRRARRRLSRNGTLMGRLGGRRWRARGSWCCCTSCMRCRRSWGLVSCRGEIGQWRGVL